MLTLTDKKRQQDHGDLPARAGSIQAAINLEIADPSMTHFNLKVEGLNGQLPNLDLVNLINRLCAREGVGQMFQNVEDHPRPGEAHHAHSRTSDMKTWNEFIYRHVEGLQAVAYNSLDDGDETGHRSPDRKPRTLPPLRYRSPHHRGCAAEE